MGNNEKGNIVINELQAELDRLTNIGDTEVKDNGEEFEVVFINTSRYYTVNKDGNIIGEGKIIIDKSPGDITKDENGNTLKGDETQPYEIWCIEDLVAFSKEVNNKNNYVNKYICLMQDLDFSSNYSYNDPTTTEYDIYLGGQGNTTLKEQLSNEGTGFKTIASLSAPNEFRGVFDGNGKKIKNIYIKGSGFFGYIAYATIKNLIIQGEVKSDGDVAGIVYNAVVSYIYNCYNEISVTRPKCWWNMSNSG